jgi:hypothetical protein
VGPGAKVSSGEKQLGEITSATSLRNGHGDRTLALGYIRRESGLPGKEVEIGSTKALISGLPFQDV